jgi:hypothetical protein
MVWSEAVTQKVLNVNILYGQLDMKYKPNSSQEFRTEILKFIFDSVGIKSWILELNVKLMRIPSSILQDFHCETK